MRGLKHNSLYRLLEAITVPDLFAVIMGLCAIGLVLIPELVYVRDIYENGNARANTCLLYTSQYPHYGGQDVKYHFMFQFLVGNLEYLGLRLDLGYNLVSILSLAGFLIGVNTGHSNFCFPDFVLRNRQ